jgi:hypothetical protein
MSLPDLLDEATLEAFVSNGLSFEDAIAVISGIVKRGGDLDLLATRIVSKYPQSKIQLNGRCIVLLYPGYLVPVSWDGKSYVFAVKEIRLLRLTVMDSFLLLVTNTADPIGDYENGGQVLFRVGLQQNNTIVWSDDALHPFGAFESVRAKVAKSFSVDGEEIRLFGTFTSNDRNYDAFAPFIDIPSYARPCRLARVWLTSERGRPNNGRIPRYNHEKHVITGDVWRFNAAQIIDPAKFYPLLYQN